MSLNFVSIGYVPLDQAIQEIGARFIVGWTASTIDKWRLIDSAEYEDDVQILRIKIQELLQRSMTRNWGGDNWDDVIPGLFGANFEWALQYVSKAYPFLSAAFRPSARMLDNAPENAGWLDTDIEQQLDDLICQQGTFETSLMWQLRMSYQVQKAWDIFRQNAEAGNLSAITHVHGDRFDVRSGYWVLDERPGDLLKVHVWSALAEDDLSKVKERIDRYCYAPAAVEKAGLEEFLLLTDTEKDLRYQSNDTSPDVAIRRATLAVIGAATLEGMQGGSVKVKPIVDHLLSERGARPQVKAVKSIVGETLPQSWRGGGDPTRKWDDNAIRARLDLPPADAESDSLDELCGRTD